MKSKKVEELTKWLDSKVRAVDLPRDYSGMEVTLLVEIAEIEQELAEQNLTVNVNKFNEKLDEKVKKFKERYI